MKKIIYILLLFATTNTLKAQSQSKEISETIATFFMGMTLADTNMIKTTLAPNWILQTIMQKKDEAIIVKTETIDAFLKSIAKGNKNDFDEQYSITQLINEEFLAQVWTPYVFYYKLKRSHAGNNAFTLVKINNFWKINYIIDTRKN